MSTSIRQLPGRIDAALQAPWQVRAMAIVDAIIATVVILLAGTALRGEFPVATVGTDDQPIGFVPVIMVTVVVGLLAWGLLALLELMTSRAMMIWTTIAVVVFLLSLLGPLGSGVDTSSRIVLALMHTGAAATIILLMRRSA